LYWATKEMYLKKTKLSTCLFIIVCFSKEMHNQPTK